MNCLESDAELIAAFCAGDRSAFASLYQRHKDKVYSIALYFFHGDEGAAADITQQVFLKLIGDIFKFRGSAEFSTWLHRLVVNTCIDAARRRKREASAASPLSEQTSPIVDRRQTPAAQLEQKQLTKTVQEAVNSLPEPFRLAVLLRHFDQLSYEEMAGALQCSIGTVASRLSRAHKLLAESLAPLRARFQSKE